MKKIALLCTIVCAGQLHSMYEGQNEKSPISMPNLPKEVQVLIIQALKSGNDLNETIKAIQAASTTSKTLNQMINEQYGDVSNLKGFTALVGVLANQFPDKTRREIASKFNTPIAKQYNELGTDLIDLIRYRDNYNYNATDEKYLKHIVNHINQRADVDYTMKDGFGDDMNPLILAVAGEEVDTVKLLLEYGANPMIKINGKTPLDETLERIEETYIYPGQGEETRNRLLAIKQLLEEAIKKQQK